MSFTRLADVQRAVVDRVRLRAPIPADPRAAEDARAIATGNARLAPEEQLDVYREQFWLRHVASLDEDYPTLRHLLRRDGRDGRDGFEELCAAYLTEYPPQVFALRDLGDRIPAFVAAHAPWNADDLLAECARVEWAFIEAFDGPDAPALDPASLARIGDDDWPNVVMTLHPSLQRLALRYPSHDFRMAVRRGEDPPRPSPIDGGAFLVVFRDEVAEVVRYLTIPEPAFRLLDQLARGVPLGAACEAVAPLAGGEDALQEALPVWFQQWTQSGWIVALDVRGDATS